MSTFMSFMLECFVPILLPPYSEIKIDDSPMKGTKPSKGKVKGQDKEKKKKQLEVVEKKDKIKIDELRVSTKVFKYVWFQIVALKILNNQKKTVNFLLHRAVGLIHIYTSPCLE